MHSLKSNCWIICRECSSRSQLTVKNSKILRNSRRSSQRINTVKYSVWKIVFKYDTNSNSYMVQSNRVIAVAILHQNTRSSWIANRSSFDLVNRKRHATATSFLKQRFVRIDTCSSLISFAKFGFLIDSTKCSMRLAKYGSSVTIFIPTVISSISDHNCICFPCWLIFVLFTYYINVWKELSFCMCTNSPQSAMVKLWLQNLIIPSQCAQYRQGTVMCQHFLSQYQSLETQSSDNLNEERIRNKKKII